MFIAHRGNDNHKYRENSEKAILFSLKQDYISGIECDIRITKDKKIVLFHNSLIDFESDGSGFIHNLELEELKLYSFKDDKITVLEELLEHIDTNKILLLEIKEERIEFITDWIEALEPILKKYSYMNIYLCSFNYVLISKLKEKFNIPIGIIIGYTINQKKDTSQFDFIMYQYKNFKYTHKTTMVWTINDKEKLKELRNKADYIISDKSYEFL